MLLMLAGVLNLWALEINGWANDYYSAAVRSMSTSWHAFLYGSFDVAGVMTVDKPPLALWVQALSARIFGLHPLSLLVPQALMGVATVAFAYDLTRRRFGRAAGGVAGLVLALTPMTVAISRHNNPDALLVLCITAAVWAVVRGLEDGRLRWVLLAGLLVGLGFETKMGAALLVVPGLAAAWLLAARGHRGARLRGLLAGGGALTVAGGAWPVLVSLTPASSRPWISGTSDNSIWSLILGYNGFGRLFGQSGGPDGIGGGPGGGGPGGGPFGGQTGTLRLLNESLGAQAGWLLGAAVAGVIGLAVLTRLRRTDPRTGWLVAVGGPFLVTAVAFSRADGIFHPYYVSALAPFTAALVGATAGVVLRGGRVARILGPAALAAGLVTELVVLRNDPGQLSWLPGVLAAVVALAAAALAAGTGTRARAALVAVALAALLVAPEWWSVETLGHPTSGTFPAGGPASAGLGGFPGGPPPGAGAPGTGRARASAGGFGGRFGDTQSLASATAYAAEHGGGTVAVSSQSGAAGPIIASGADVAGIGGFSGRESQVSVTWLADAVASGKIRWVLTGSGGVRLQADTRVGASGIMGVAARTCTATGAGGLYDCAGKAAALRAAAR